MLNSETKSNFEIKFLSKKKQINFNLKIQN
jgi:hypothetical protein